MFVYKLLTRDFYALFLLLLKKYSRFKFFKIDFELNKIIKT